jgi:hypothetical protein
VERGVLEDCGGGGRGGGRELRLRWLFRWGLVAGWRSGG